MRNEIPQFLLYNIRFSEFSKHVQKTPKSWERFVQLRSFIRIPKSTLTGLKNLQNCLFFFPPLFQTCLNPGFGEKSRFSLFFLRFLGILETCRWWHAIIMTFDTFFSTQQVCTGQFPVYPYRAHSPKLEPCTAEKLVGTMFWASRTVLGSKNTVYYHYSLQIH